ncbi:TPA: UDP-N-acetylmuramate dehydrogenase [bacterium]|nr:UDP-N-acetylmuramate dehydrogenase [bacterium]
MYQKASSIKIKGLIKRDELISPYLTIKAGGRVSWFITPETIEDIFEIVSFANNEGYDWLVLGNGSKLLISDKGFNGIIIYTRNLRDIVLDREEMILHGGAPIGEAIRLAVKSKLSGLEPLVGIPGTIGGAVVMNAGTAYGSVGKLVKSVEYINSEGLLSVKDNPSFGYRDSEFKGKRVLITRILLKLSSSLSEDIDERLKSSILLRKSQPRFPRQFGSVFKNPQEVSAGKLIEEAGFKGFVYNKVQVSPVHANFILNFGESADDVYYVLKLIQERVFKFFNILLEPEVITVGF